MSFPAYKAKEAQVVILYGKAAIGSSGAATIDTDDSKGVASITRSATGTYDVVLSQAYAKVLSFHGFILKSTAEDITCQLKSDSVASSKTFQFITRSVVTTEGTSAGAATDPSSGAVLYFEVHVKNTSV